MDLEAVYYAAPAPTSNQSLTLPCLVFDRLIVPGVHVPSEGFDFDETVNEYERMRALPRTEPDHFHLLNLMSAAFNAEHLKDFCIFPADSGQFAEPEEGAHQLAHQLELAIFGPPPENSFPTVSLRARARWPIEQQYLELKDDLGLDHFEGRSRTVAIKILSQELASDPQFHERFDREAKSISQLNHPNICTLYDVGEAVVDQESSSPASIRFLVMEFLEGESLAARLERGALTLEEALKIAGEISGALDEAHRAGIVHRDLKPGNVMLTRSGGTLLDFGLAKQTASPLMSRRGSAIAAAAAMSGALTLRAPSSGPCSTWRSTPTPLTVVVNWQAAQK